jgi:dTDP-4-amino-4,6-dideoxygalactose transaminase
MRALDKSEERIPLFTPHMGKSELKYVIEAFEENWIAPAGANIGYFEQSLESFLSGENFVAALNSGTAAVHLALIMTGVKRGDEVICQSMTFSASANPIVYLGATPIFIDSEPDTWNMDPEVMEMAIKDRISKGKKPKAIIAVHIYGMPFNVDKITAIAKAYGIPLIEDSAEALGSRYKGKTCGTFGDLSVLSFNGNKIITTSGGGALVSRTAEAKQRAIFLATQARECVPYYQHSEIGYNYRLSNICAGIGRGQMEVLQDRVTKRRGMHTFYKELFNNKEGVNMFTEPNEDYFSNHWLSCLKIDSGRSGFSADDLRNALEDANIESRMLWKPMHLQPVFEKAAFYGGTVAQELFENGLCLPSGTNLKVFEKQRIREVIEQFL